MKRKGRGSSKEDLVLMKQLAHFSKMTSESSIQVTADQLRKRWKGKHQTSMPSPESFAEGAEGFKSKVFVSKRQRWSDRQNSFVRSYNIEFKDALEAIGSDDKKYLMWFMSDRAQGSYSFLNICQDAFSTQNSINYIQKIHRCFGEREKDGDRCYAVFTSKEDPGGSSILVIQSDRLEVLRLMALPHLDRKRMLPLYPFYMRRISFSPSRICDQRWVYCHAMKSMVLYLCSLIDPKILNTNSNTGICSMGTPLFLEIYMKLPKIIDLFAETDAQVTLLIKESFENPSQGFLRYLKAFFLQDTKHYIDRDMLLLLRGWFGDKHEWQLEMRRKYPAQLKLVHELDQISNRLTYKNWVPIEKPVIRVKPDGHRVRQRKPLGLMTATGELVDEKIPLHALLYQLVWSDDTGIAKKARRQLFCSMIVDPEADYTSTRRHRVGMRTWSYVASSLMDYHSFCMDYGEDPDGLTVKQAWEVSNLNKFASSLEKSSRMSKKEVSQSSYMGGTCHFDLKKLAQSDLDLPIFVESSSSVTPVYFGEFFPSIKPKIDLGASIDAVGFQVTREFLEFHYLVRMKSYFRDQESWSLEINIDEEEEEEEEVSFFADELVEQALKRAKIVRRVKISH